jgi:hypothetical protein
MKNYGVSSKKRKKKKEKKTHIAMQWMNKHQRNRTTPGNTNHPTSSS